MNPIFVDLHIHTSKNPQNLNVKYDLSLLKNKIESFVDNSDYLISLTDHNTINKPVYLKAVQLFKYILLGVELHVRNYDKEKPYHCHIYFKTDKIDDVFIDIINTTLDTLYPNKIVEKDDPSIPTLEEIMKKFDPFDFVLLPHGGQTHSAFDHSIPSDVKFDSTLERSIYYNHFDGFTARSNKGLEKTLEYFERLGINEFVNLVTSSDNYNPNKYPDAKTPDASPFVPTWMLSSPTFNGLRLSLSEASRFRYGDRPDAWSECIQKVYLNNKMINIDVKLTPGLNVVIGGSSSGKSLLVDTIYRKIKNDFNGCVYINYDVNNMQVTNPAGQIPHYLPQNYISKVCDQKDKEKKIDDISILKNIFPENKEERELIENGMSELCKNLSKLVQSVKEIEGAMDELSRIPKLSRLLITESIQRNPLKYILPPDNIIEKIEYKKAKYERHTKVLNEIESFLSYNPLIKHDSNLIKKLKDELLISFESSKIEGNIRDIIKDYEKIIDNDQERENQEITTKRKQFQTLLDQIKRYIKNHKQFYNSLEAISKFSITIKTKELKSMGHVLFIDNKFKLTKDKFLDVINELLRKEAVIKTFKEIKPESLFEAGYKKRGPKVDGYDDFENRVEARFREMNKKTYRIITEDGKNFDKLSAGWKTSVILDLIFGHGNDYAPLIIDQPEDNLATSYINSGLLKAIKDCKSKKQIILVSHNATIPMLGDAQNVIMCTNKDKFITIKSNPLEGEINGVEVVDLIAETTDGGKISVKKRVKKYNLKNFRGKNENKIQKR